MWKYPSDVNVSKNCVDANLEMVERLDPDNFPQTFPAAGMVRMNNNQNCP